MHTNPLTWAALLPAPQRPSAALSQYAPVPLPPPLQTSALRNANHIFNAIHSPLRQCGSSLNHNGMSLFLTSVPHGAQLYRGTH